MVRKPSPDFSASTSTSLNSTFYPPSVLSTGWDADDEDTMSTSPEDSPPQRRLSVAIPTSPIHSPYYPRRPNLREILANTSEAPWTLAAFMAFLSNNHCLETLEFTMDAGRYKKHYTKMMSRAGSSGTPAKKDCEYVQALWDRLVDAYIRPSGSREINIHSHVRQPILNLQPAELPPAPEALDPAVAMIYELMEESVLGPFLNSVYPQTAQPMVSSSLPNSSFESIPIPGSAHEDGSAYARRNRFSTRHSPPPQSAVEPHAFSYTSASMLHRKSSPSAITNANKARYSTKLSHSTSAPAEATLASIEAVASGSGTDGSGPGMTDDSASADSPSYESPTTPPTTPPVGDASKRDSGMWKKLGRLSGMKVTKKKSNGGLKEEE